MSKITIQDIAREMGLSRNTVSLALKGSPSVTKRTQERVRKYACEVGYLEEYHPKAYRKDEKIQVMLLRKPDIAVFWDKIISGISEEASAQNFQMQVAVVNAEAEETMQLPNGIDNNIKAVFCINPFEREYVKKIKDMGIMIFSFDGYVTFKGETLGDEVKMESHMAIYEIVMHLIGQGIRNIGFLSEHSHTFETMYDRYQGYVRAMEQAGLPLNKKVIYSDAENDDFYSIRTFEQIVDNLEEIPEAFVCGNDEIAKYLTRAFRNKGYKVPEDIAITGFDNDEEGVLSPFFTTVGMDVKWLGRRLVQCLARRLMYPESPHEKVVVSSKAIFRKSSIKNRISDK